MTVSASSLPNAFSTIVKDKLADETSAARLLLNEDGNNTNNMDFGEFLDITRRTLKGAIGYPLGMAATHKMLISVATAITGSVICDVPTIFGLGSADAVWVQRFGAGAASDAFKLVDWNLTNTGGSLLVRAYTATTTPTTLTYATAASSFTLFAMGAGT